MQLTRLSLNNFRSYKKSTIEFADLTVLSGDNGVGKTNVIEAIYLLSSGLSERASKIEEMISFDAEVCSVSGVVRDGDGVYRELAVVLTRGFVMSHRAPKRRLLVDGVGRSHANFVLNLPSVLFRPEDMRLIEGSPARRRGFLDETISICDQQYMRSKLLYEKSLRQRNRILLAIREGKGHRSQLAFWDQALLKHGEIIMSSRRQFINYINSYVSVNFGEYKVVYKASTISPARLLQYKVEEVMAGHTLVGPHKDDIEIMEKNKDLMRYGSRGEQRLGVLFLKLAATSYIEKITGEKPLILLDDIFSELDDRHREEILSIIMTHQCILTTAEKDVLSILPKNAKVIQLPFENLR